MFQDYFKTSSADTSLNEKLEMIAKNMETARWMKQDIGELKKAQNIEVALNPKDNDNSSFKCFNSGTIAKPVEVDQELERIYQRICLLDLNNFDDESLETALSEIIGEDNIRYYALIKKIKLRLYHEVLQYSQLLLTSDEEEKAEIKMMIDTLEIKIEALKSLEKVKELIASASPNNNFVFLSSELDNIFIIDSIDKDIPKELYFQALDLISAMKNGVFRRVKAFKSVPYFEARISDIRVTFAKISKDTYILIDIYLKKDHNSEFYHSILVNRGKQYMAKKEEIMQNLDNPDFMKEQNRIYQKMLNLLQGREDELDVGRKQ